MPNKNRLPVKGPISIEEKIGRIWAGIYIAMVVLLLVTLLGRGCFLSG